MSIRVKARVVSVRPRFDGMFRVTLGPGPRIFSYSTPNPPKLGDLVLVEGAKGTRLNSSRANQADITLLEGGRHMVVPDEWPRRVVAPHWIKMIHSVVNRKPFPYQAEGAGWLASRIAGRKGAILADDPGLGKTFQVLASIAATRATPTIIVCPTSLKDNWARELKHIKPNLVPFVINGQAGLLRPAHIYILSYATLRARAMQLAKLVRPKLIVFDEAHLLKEPLPSPTHRAAIATQFAHHIGNVVLMTGTPLLNRPEEMWRLLHIVDKKEWPDFKTYKKRYCSALTKLEREAMRKVRSIVTDHGRAKHVDELQALTAPYVLRRQRDETIKQQLPPKERRRIIVDLHPYDAAHYQKAEKDFIKWLTDVAGGERAQSAKRGQAIVKLNVLRRIAAVGKLRSAAKSYLEAWFENERRPLVVFAYHRPVLQGLESICKNAGIACVHLKGSDPSKKRQVKVDKFMGGAADVFLAPIRSAGVGLNLQRASDMLFLEREWTPALMGQAESRCHRLGQRNKVTVTYLDARNTVDEHIAKVLKAKQTLIDQVVDNKKPSREERQDMSIQAIDDIIGAMAGRRSPFRRTA